MLLKEILSKAVEQATLEAQKQGTILQTAIPEVLIERPQNTKHGDYASSIPLKISRAVSIPPLTIANNIAEFIPKLPEIEKVTVSPPGFINFVIKKEWLTDQVQEILDSGTNWGNINLGNGEKVQIEFVSVNPTGPLHVGHGRGAVLGSTLANILTAAGYDVEKEYYLNDAGSQLDAFKHTLYARYQQRMGNNIPIPEDGYMGNYMLDLANEIIQKDGSRIKNSPDNELINALGAMGFEKIIAKIKEDLELLGVKFDLWFSEKSLNTSGTYSKVMELLKKQNYLAEREKATWFVSSALGEDKDNVVVRSDGTPTYFAYDIAYHFNKFMERNFTKVIDIWGADHQGHVSRMKAAVSALGINPDRLDIIICQLVTLRRGDEIVRISKRSGDIITLKEVIDEVGADACRFVFLSRAADSQMDFDLELVKKQSAENPVYYVQYAHARISSILKLAAEKDIEFTQGDVSLLDSDPELILIKQMIRLPEIVEMAASNLEPHSLPYYAMDLATVFHSFYKQCKVVSNNREKTMARLKLVKATQIVLARTLNLMGMTAPDTM